MYSLKSGHKSTDKKLNSKKYTFFFALQMLILIFAFPVVFVYWVRGRPVRVPNDFTLNC